MKKESNPTTRMYPRTMDEAFPNDVDRAQWLYPPEKHWTIAEILLAIVGVALWIGLAYYFVKD